MSRNRSSIIKDKCRDVCNSDDYRAITISPVLSKIIDICIYDKFSSFLNSSELQFGVKPGVGCAPALFTVQQVVKYFNSRHITVHMSPIDASKAFDRVSNRLLVHNLMQRQLSGCFIYIIVNWYSKLYYTVRWKHTLSSTFKVNCGASRRYFVTYFV